MVRSNCIYQGQKHCELVHESSGSRIGTDAPKDNQGKGELFSPTDLVGAALTSCALTTMAMWAEKEGLSITGSSATVEKNMTGVPRQILSLKLQFKLPAHLNSQNRNQLETIAKNCPVSLSLNPSIQIPMQFIYE